METHPILKMWIEKGGFVRRALATLERKEKKKAGLKISKLRRILDCCLKLRRSVACVLEAKTSSSLIETANYLYLLVRIDAQYLQQQSLCCKNKKN